MNAIAFASAYRQLRPVEKAFVDSFILDVERECERYGERISNALYRPIPDAVKARSQGMLDRPMVCAAIAERINELAAAAELSPRRVIKELMSIGFSSLDNYMVIGEDGQPYFDLSKCTPEQLAAIKTIKVEERGSQTDRGNNTRKFEIVLHDKLAALTKLVDYMGLSNPDNAHWRSEQARPVNETTLPAAVTVEQAQEAYLRASG